MIRIITFLILTVFLYAFAPSDEAKSLLKVRETAPTYETAPITAIATEAVREAPAASQAVTETSPPPPAPATCRDDQWVRADNGQCLDKPKPAPEVKADVPAAPAQAHAPVSVTAGSGSCDIAYSFPWDGRLARAICMAESGNNPGAVGDIASGIPSCGLMQIRTLPGRPSCDQLKDGYFNMQYAYNMYKSQGWRPWSAYTNGAYARYY